MPSISRRHFAVSHEPVAVLHLQPEIKTDEKAVRPSDQGIGMLFFLSDPGPDGAVIKARIHMNLKFGLSLDALQNSQDLLMGVVLSPLSHGKEIEKSRLPVPVAKGGFKNQRVLQVGTGNFARGDGRNLTVSAVLPIQNSAETTAGIDSRHAAPVDGT